MTYGHLQADCLYTGISSGPNTQYRVWEAFTFCLSMSGKSIEKAVPKLKPLVDCKNCSCFFMCQEVTYSVLSGTWNVNVNVTLYHHLWCHQTLEVASLWASLLHVCCREVTSCRWCGRRRDNTAAGARMASERVAMISVSKDHAHISVELLFPREPGFASLNLDLPVWTWVFQFEPGFASLNLGLPVVPFILMGD